MGKRELAKDIIDQQSGEKREVNPLIFVFQPQKDKEKGDNNLYIGMYDIGSIPQLKNLKKPKNTWVYCYAIQSHYIHDAAGGSGHYICQNPAKNFFIDSHKKCRFCETANKIWDIRKKYQGDQEYDAIKEDKIFKQLSKHANKFSSWKRMPYVILDVDKALGKKPLSEKEREEGFGMQVVGMPLNADKEIRQIIDDGFHFWDPVDENGKECENPNYIYVVNVKRDNSAGAKNAKYSASIKKELVRLKSEWIEVIQTDIPNPIEILFKNPSEEEWNSICDKMLPTDEEIEGYATLESDTSKVSAPVIASSTTAAASIPVRKKVDLGEQTTQQEGAVEVSPATEQPKEEDPSTTPRRRRKAIDFNSAEA